MSKHISVVTDSGCDLPSEVISETGIRVVPLTVRFGDDEFVDGVELTNQEFWDRVAIASTLPSTAAPSPGAFEAAFKQAAESGSSGVICVTLSSKLSATYQSAMTAAQMVADVIPVRIIDSLLCTVGQGTLCVQAAQHINEGLDLDQVVAKVSALQQRMHIFGALDTLDHLRMGGRIGAANAFFGSLLSVKPIIRLHEGLVEAESRQRTRNKALDHLARLVTDRAPVSHLAVSHSQALDLDAFLNRLQSLIPSGVTPLISSIGPIIGTHGGPGLIAVSFASD